jgi:gas vesicle protein
MESGKVILGVLAGVAIGAVVGILLAPEKGSVTRKQFLGKGEDYADRLGKKLDSFIESVSENYATTHQTAEELGALGKAKFEGLKKEIRDKNV